MKYLPLLFKNLFRRKTRLALTVGSFAVATILFGFLAIVHNSFSLAGNVAGVDRVMVQNRVSIIQPLPLSYRDRILQIPGVKEVTYSNWFGGVYKDERNFFPQYAVDVPTWRSMYPELKVPDDQWKTFAEEREACIVGSATAKKYGFKIGDRIPIKGTIFPGTWEFNVRGIYDSDKNGQDLTQFWFHSDYFNERRPERGKGLVGWYVVRVDNPDHSVKVTGDIDANFSNSSYETKTQTEKAFIAGWAKQTGNIGLLVTIIGGIVFFTLLLVIGNTMAMAVRERVRELAVFKAIGFSDGFVLTLVLAESTLIALIGGFLGLGAVELLTTLGDPTGMIQAFYLPVKMALIGVALIFSVGFLSGVLPALSAGRLRVVDALRRV